MSVGRVPSHTHAAGLDEPSRIGDAHHDLHAHHARRKARSYRHSTFRHGIRTQHVHSPAKAQHLLARMSAAGVTHRRVATLHRDSDGKRGSDGGRDGGSHQHGKQQQGRERERQQQKEEQKQARPPRPPGARPGLPPRATGGFGTLAVGSRVAPHDVASSDCGAPVAKVEPTVVQAPDATALDRPMLRDEAMRTAWTDRFFSIGELLRTEQTSQTSQLILSTTLELLRTRRDAGFLADSFDDNLASVRQDLIDTQRRLRGSHPSARPGDRLGNFNALLPLMVLSARRPLTGSLVDRSIRHVTVLSRAPAGTAPRAASDPA